MSWDISPESCILVYYQNCMKHLSQNQVEDLRILPYERNGNIEDLQVSKKLIRFSNEMTTKVAVPSVNLNRHTMRRDEGEIIAFMFKTKWLLKSAEVLDLLWMET